MNSVTERILVALCMLLSFCTYLSWSFNVGTSGAKVFSGPMAEEFGYTVQHFKNHQGKWLLVGSPWSGYQQNRKGNVYKCEIPGSKTTCEKLNLQNSVSIQSVKNVNINMSLGLTLTRMPVKEGFMTCAPLWAQQCGSQYFVPGICTEVSPLFAPLPPFAPAIQTCGGPMDVVIVLDGSNSIWPWAPVVAFLKKLLETLDIGPSNTQVSVIQYAVGPSFEFKLNSYTTKQDIVAAASKIAQKEGQETNTFHAIEFAREQAFLPANGGRPGASKVMVVVTDGESHDKSMRDTIIPKCEEAKITRFGIAVLGYYLRNDIDTKNLIAEIKSIASNPTEKHFFNVTAEGALLEIAGTLGDRIFNIEGTGKGGDSFQMEMSQVGFSAHYSSKEDVLMLGAVGAYAWSGTVVHKTNQKTEIFPKNTFEKILQDKNDSSLLGYSVTTLLDGSSEYYVAGAPRSNHTGQVIVYTINGQGLPTVIDSQRGDQIGSYFGSVLCPLDVDKDGAADLLLVGAPMYMSERKKERGKVYLFSVTKGILSDQGFLDGPSSLENTRFGMAISAVPDLNLDGFSDVVVGAPLEDSNRGVIYIFNGDRKTIRREHSQRILGAELDPKMQYFGRSLDAHGDLNDDTIPDISVGAYGKVVQLWSRGVAMVTTTATFLPDKINILSKPCSVGGKKVFCFKIKVCFSAVFRPKTPVGPVAITYNITLDADLQSSRVTSRGLFTSNNERHLQKDIRISTTEICEDSDVYVQDAPDFVSSIGVRVDIALQKPGDNPVLDMLSPQAWEFFIPFSKDCGSDEVCVSNLVLKVEDRKAPLLVSYGNKTNKISFAVSVENRNENAYNARVIATYSKNLFYASITAPSDGTDVKCTATKQSETLSCQLGYPALHKNQQVTFKINFDFNFNQLQSKVDIHFEAESDSKEETPTDNTADVSFNVQYDSEISLTRDANINFYVVNEESTVKTTVEDYNDIGPEFSFRLKASTGNIPVSLAYLTVSLPVSTKGGNPLFYLTGVKTKSGGGVNCEESGLVDPLEISKRPYTTSYSPENFRGTEELNCKSATCKAMKCVLKDMEVKHDYFVNITTRVWNGTFASATFQSIMLSVTMSIETSEPELLVINPNELPVGIMISKPQEKADVPVGVIVGSVIGGLLLLAAAVLLLWKLGFFKSKYQQLMKEGENEPENEGLQQDEA
ncbi:integrin alpha-2-like [Megalops cyprinoides]|uniref:integrin alpha-2-like n=1 Tax=Megalops cyprinoides TaxID=118141 RepID=UPI001864F646|nr:integrin alpha-2-like [Megalops cyprinoides]